MGLDADTVALRVRYFTNNWLFWMAVTVGSASAVTPRIASAADGDRVDPTTGLTDEQFDRLPEQDAVLPKEWELAKPNYWVLGVAFERAGQRDLGSSLLRDQLYGVSVAYKWKEFSPYIRALINVPQAFNEYRILTVGGFRSYIEPYGVEVSYGVGTHFEVRLKDHYWLAALSPLELGTTLLRSGSLRVQLFSGVRFAFAGELIDNFLFDPNGINNARAQDELNRLKRVESWEGFFTVVFGRAL